MLPVVRLHRPHQGMEVGSVVQVDEVTEFMDDDDTDTGIGGADQHVVERDRPRRAATSPSAAHAAYLERAISKTMDAECGQHSGDHLSEDALGIAPTPTLHPTPGRGFVRCKSFRDNDLAIRQCGSGSVVVHGICRHPPLVYSTAMVKLPWRRQGWYHLTLLGGPDQTGGDPFGTRTEELLGFGNGSTGRDPDDEATIRMYFDGEGTPARPDQLIGHQRARKEWYRQCNVLIRTLLIT